MDAVVVAPVVDTDIGVVAEGVEETFTGMLVLGEVPSDGRDVSERVFESFCLHDLDDQGTRAGSWHLQRGLGVFIARQVVTALQTDAVNALNLLLLGELCEGLKEDLVACSLNRFFQLCLVLVVRRDDVLQRDQTRLPVRLDWEEHVGNGASCFVLRQWLDVDLIRFLLGHLLFSILELEVAVREAKEKVFLLAVG